MADIRSLLKNERAARRIQHKYASYSSTGTLLCTACHLQLKSDTLWDGHLRSAGHILRLQKLQEAVPLTSGVTNDKKRKVDSDEEDDDVSRKRSKTLNGFLLEGSANGKREDISPPMQIQIPSRPATPARPSAATPKVPAHSATAIDEDEWAAFEADIAAADVSVVDSDAVISAPAMTSEKIKKKSAEEEYAARKERQEAEIEGDKEDAARKMEDDLEQMENLEARVKTLRQKREALRQKETGITKTINPAEALNSATGKDEEEESEDDDDDWRGFRMRA